MEKKFRYGNWACPVNGWDCPYWDGDNGCTCENAIEECDDYMTFYTEEEEE